MQQLRKQASPVGAISNPGSTSGSGTVAPSNSGAATGRTLHEVLIYCSIVFKLMHCFVWNVNLSQL